MKPSVLGILFLATLISLLIVGPAEAATVTIQDNTQSGLHIGLGINTTSTVRGNDVIFVNVSDLGNATNCTLIFRSGTRNDSFAIFIQNQTNQSGTTGNLTGANIQRAGANSASWMNHSATNFMPTGPGDGGGGLTCTSNYCTANSTTNATFLVGNVSVTALREDAADWRVTGFCANNSAGGVANGSEAAITATTLVFDSSRPAAPTSLTTESGEISVSLTSTVVNNDTTNCTAYITENSAQTNAYAMSKNQNSTTCSLALTTLSASNTYTWFAEAGDGTNKTNSTQTTLTLTQDSSVSGVATAYLNQQAQAQQTAQTQAQAATAAAATSARNKTIGIVAGLALLFLVLRKKR